MLDRDRSNGPRDDEHQGIAGDLHGAGMKWKIYLKGIFIRVIGM